MEGILYHWREKAHQTKDLPAYEGSAYLGHEQHGVYLTRDGEDPNVYFNSDIFHYQRPVRYEIDASKLDPALLQADLNSLLGDNGESWAHEKGIDLHDPKQYTVENSLAATGNIHYQGSIPLSAIRSVTEYEPVRKWLDEDVYIDLYGEDSWESLQTQYAQKDQELLCTPRVIEHNSPPLPVDEKYVYHITNIERAQEILMDGFLHTHNPDDFTEQDTWPDGSTVPRVYFGATTNLYHFAPEEGDAVMLRMLRNESHQIEGYTRDVYSEKDVDAGALEIYCKGGWKDLASMYIPRPSVAQATLEQESSFTLPENEVALTPDALQ